MIANAQQIVDDSSRVKIVFGRRRSGKTTVIQQCLRQFKNECVVVVPYESAKNVYRIQGLSTNAIISVREFLDIDSRQIGIQIFCLTSFYCIITLKT